MNTLVFAAGEIGEYTAPTGLPGKETELSTVFTKFGAALLPLVSGIAALLLIFSGIKYALAAGDEEKQAQAKRMLVWTLIGFGIALLAYVLVNFITKTVG